MGLKYEPSLDGLRAIAIAAVMAFHFAGRYVSGGSLGVDVFFVLSGWLITSILTAETESAGRIHYRAFLMRRVRRLLPALAVLLIAYAALAPVALPQFAPGRWVDVAAAAFYVTNLRETFWPTETPLSHTWSLAIEEQFYILWPLALTILLRLPRRTAALVLLAAWAGLTFARFACAGVWPGHPAAYYLTPLHATGLLLGAALALNPVATNLGRIALAALFAMLIAGHTTTAFIYVQPLAEIAAAVVIAHPPRLLASAPLRFVGKISYGVYLWHIPLMWLLPHHTAAEILTLVAASLLAGWMSHVLVERWFLAPRQPELAILPA